MRRKKMARQKLTSLLIWKIGFKREGFKEGLKERSDLLRPTSWLHMALKKFQNVQEMCCKLLRHSLGPRLYNARRFRVIRCKEKKCRGKNHYRCEIVKNFKHVKGLTCASLFFNFLKKVHPLRIFEEMHVEHSGYHKGVISIDIRKLILQPFRLL